MRGCDNAVVEAERESTDEIAVIQITSTGLFMEVLDPWYVGSEYSRSFAVGQRGPVVQRFPKCLDVREMQELASDDKAFGWIIFAVS